MEDNSHTRRGTGLKPADSTPSAVDPSIEAHHGGTGQTVTPWDVEAEGGIDYDKLVRDFGCSRITEALVARIERLTGKKAHRFLRRGIFFSHRDLEELLDAYERGEKFYLYTGRGPSTGSLHLGHLIPFMFTQYLQQAFQVPLVIQLTDDEKFLWKDMTLDSAYGLSIETVKDIIACGFDPDLTFIFRDMDYIDTLYPNILRIQKAVTFSQARGIFGFTGDANIGKVAFPAVQAAPSFPSSFPVVLGGDAKMRCLVPQGIDQDPYFRMTRDAASKLGFRKPALIHNKFFPALQGNKTKMSASSEATTILVTDTAAAVSRKVSSTQLKPQRPNPGTIEEPMQVRKHAFSGGQATAELQRLHGANLEVDVPYQYLTFLLEDDEELQRIGEDYRTGELLTSEVQSRLIEVIAEIVGEHQRRRAAITDDVLKLFMSERPLKR